MCCQMQLEVERNRLKFSLVESETNFGHIASIMYRISSKMENLTQADKKRYKSTL